MSKVIFGFLVFLNFAVVMTGVIFFPEEVQRLIGALDNAFNNVFTYVVFGVPLAIILGVKLLSRPLRIRETEKND
jgi:uncharacterized membrane protein